MELSKEHIKLMLFNEFEQGSSPTDAMKRVCSIYGTIVNENQLQYWYSMFRRNKSSKSKLQSERLRLLLAENPNSNVHKLAKELELSYLTAQSCLRDFRNKTRLAAAEAALPSTDEDDEDVDDEDLCNANELDQLFQCKYRKSDEAAVTLTQNYILSLCQGGDFTRLAAGLSNGEVQIFDINNDLSLRHAKIDYITPPVASNKKELVNICGVQFLEDESANCLLIGTTNGLVRLYDIRTQRVEANFEVEVERSNQFQNITNITCFERNANSRVLCTGTERHQNTVYMIFYDIRQRKQLGAYSESHEDDITTVRFHSRNPDLLCSGSIDGLINIFNIKENNEDDALLTTINTESSVHKLNWHKNIYEKDILSCVTQSNDFKAYDCEEGDLIVEFDRNKITANMKRRNPANCNLINAHNTEDGGVFLLAGTNLKKGEILRTLRLQNKDLIPMADFDSNKQIVRESIFNPKNQSLITAGESGIVTLWTPENFGNEKHSTSSANKLKLKTKLNSSKKNPY